MPVRRLEAIDAGRRAREQALAAQLANPADTLDPTALAAVADRLRDTLARSEPEQTKALLRLIKELRVNGRSEILPTYRVVTPEVCATPSSVAAPGIEPRRAAESESPADLHLQGFIIAARCRLESLVLREGAKR